MISVCMATFNGSNYIEEQLKSILVQIDINDEIIIVDDTSSDNTLSLIYNFNDPRIKIFKNALNSGVIKSFERAVSLAKGDVIFLSDQDDIWLPDKVEKIMNLFTSDCSLTLCLSDANIIDGSNIIQDDTYFERRDGFKSGIFSNIIKNKFLGCSIAFKQSIVGHILPIPLTVPAHDMWIGIINEIYGKSEYIDTPLFQYRRHSHNVSSMKHENILIMLRWRIILIYHLLRRVALISFKRI